MSVSPFNDSLVNSTAALSASDVYSPYVLVLLVPLVIVAGLGCVSNGLILAVFASSKPIRKLKTLSSLIVLAVVDFANCAGVCVMLTYSWTTNAALNMGGGSRAVTCLIVTQINVFTNLISSFMMVFIAVDRWSAMCSPIEYHAKNHRQSAWRWVAMCAVYCSVFYFFPIAEQNVPWMRTLPFCQATVPLLSQMYLDALKIQQAAMGVILVTFYLLARRELKKLLANQLSGDVTNAWVNAQNMEQEQALTKVIMTTLTPFLLLVSIPNIALLFLRAFPSGHVGLYLRFFFTALVIMGGYVNSLINIFIYLAKHSLFRRSLIELFRGTQTTPVVQVWSALRKDESAASSQGLNVAKLHPKFKIQQH